MLAAIKHFSHAGKLPRPLTQVAKKSHVTVNIRMVVAAAEDALLATVCLCTRFDISDNIILCLSF